MLLFMGDKSNKIIDNKKYKDKREVIKERLRADKTEVSEQEKAMMLLEFALRDKALIDEMWYCINFENTKYHMGLDKAW